jgi:hypothetical protein
MEVLGEVERLGLEWMLSSTLGYEGLGVEGVVGMCWLKWRFGKFEVLVT